MAGVGLCADHSSLAGDVRLLAVCPPHKHGLRACSPLALIAVLAKTTAALAHVPGMRNGGLASPHLSEAPTQPTCP